MSSEKLPIQCESVPEDHCWEIKTTGCLKYKLTRAIPSSPTQIWTLPEPIIRKGLNTLMALTIGSKLVSSITADKAEFQFSGLVRNAGFISEIKGFDKQNKQI